MSLSRIDAGRSLPRNFGPHSGASTMFEQDRAVMSDRIVYLMRGLPSCGKSHLARRLAGSVGVICETDEFFFTQVGDDPESYDYDGSRMDEARQWNLDRFCDAVESGVSRVIVDRGNSRSLESCVYIEFAQAHGYQVEL